MAGSGAGWPASGRAPTRIRPRCLSTVGRGRGAARMEKDENDTRAEGLPLEAAWRTWGPPSEVKALDEVGYNPAEQTICGPLNSEYVNNVRILPVLWLRNKIVSGELVLFAQSSKDWTENSVKFPVSRVGDLTLGANDWTLCCGNQVLHFPLLYRAEDVSAGRLAAPMKMKGRPPSPIQGVAIEHIMRLFDREGVPVKGDGGQSKIVAETLDFLAARRKSCPVESVVHQWFRLAVKEYKIRSDSISDKSDNAF